MTERTDDLDVVACTRCPELVESRSRIVNGTGPADASIVFVGEGPGATEDAEGEPFVGRSGTVLDETLRTVGLSRSDVRITNCVRCRPPENRNPTATELDHCREYLDAELDALDPSVIVPLGKVPSEHLLDRSVAVTTEAGSVETIRIAGTSRTLVISVHPAATLYDRSQSATFEEAIRTAADLAGEGVSDQSRLDGF